MQARLDRADSQAIYEGMVDNLVEEYAVKRGMFLSVLPWATLDNHHAEYEHLMERGFEPGSRLLYPNRYIVNLRLDDAAQRKSFEQKWRYHLNKSEKAGLAFEHAGPDRLPEFDALYEQLVQRKQFADHSAYDTVASLMAIQNPALRPELFFVQPRRRGRRRRGDLQGRRARRLSLWRHDTSGAGPARRVLHALAHHPVAARQYAGRVGTTWAVPTASRGCISSRRGWSERPA
jgi:hypothetical protein